IKSLTSETHPLSAASGCLHQLEQAPDLARGLVVNMPTSSFGHASNYYLRRVRPWIMADAAIHDRPWVIGGIAPTPDRYLTDPANWRPVLVKRSSYEALRRVRQVSVESAGDAPIVSAAAMPDEMVLLLPGPYAVCNPLGQR